MAKIFVSYNRHAAEVARGVTADIDDLGHAVWFDHKLSGGQIWWDEILEAVRDCSIFVFILSPEALNSVACQREYGYAAALGKPILPVLVAEGVSVNLLPAALSQIQFVDYRQQDRKSLAELARALSRVPDPKPLPAPLPPPPDAPISYLGGVSSQLEAASILRYEDQSALVIDLRRGLRDPETADDSRILLQKLRKRRDLFATIADEIDELLGSARVTAPPAARSPEPLPQERKTQPAVVANASGGVRVRLMWKDRLRGALYLGALGLVTGLLSTPGISGRFWSITVIAGAFAGLIGGPRRGSCVGALAAMVLTVYFYRSYILRTYDLMELFALLAPSVGAAVNVLIVALLRRLQPATIADLASRR